MTDRISDSDMASMLKAMADNKALWIGTHDSGKDKRPQWTIDLARRDLRCLRQAAADYAARQEGKAA